MFVVSCQVFKAPKMRVVFDPIKRRYVTSPDSTCQPGAPVHNPDCRVTCGTSSHAVQQTTSGKRIIRTRVASTHDSQNPAVHIRKRLPEARAETNGAHQLSILTPPRLHSQRQWNDAQFRTLSQQIDKVLAAQQHHLPLVVNIVDTQITPIFSEARDILAEAVRVRQDEAAEEAAPVGWLGRGNQRFTQGNFTQNSFVHHSQALRHPSWSPAGTLSYKKSEPRGFSIWEESELRGEQRRPHTASQRPEISPKINSELVWPLGNEDLPIVYSPETGRCLRGSCCSLGGNISDLHNFSDRPPRPRPNECSLSPTSPNDEEEAHLDMLLEKAVGAKTKSVAPANSDTETKSNRGTGIVRTTTPTTTRLSKTTTTNNNQKADIGKQKNDTKIVRTTITTTNKVVRRSGASVFSSKNN